MMWLIIVLFFYIIQVVSLIIGFFEMRLHQIDVYTKREFFLCFIPFYWVWVGFKQLKQNFEKAWNQLR